MSSVFAACAAMASTAASATAVAPTAPKRVFTREILPRCRAERVAGARVAAFHPALEPLDALRRRSMREAVRHHAAGGHPLQTIVADRGGRAERCLRLARVV